jgi:hypothetical protein
MQLGIKGEKADLRPLVLEGQVVVDQPFQSLCELLHYARQHAVLRNVDYEEVGWRNRRTDHVVLFIIGFKKDGIYGYYLRGILLLCKKIMGIIKKNQDFSNISFNL